MAESRVKAEKQVRLSYILAKVAEEEKLEILDAEVDETILKVVEHARPTDRNEVRRSMEKRRDFLRGDLKQEKIISFLIEKAQVI